mmetsp:Transcript_29674/g.69840  ORF Transcript_29674/g.69840 Transcript_29674/m.69840 type:complete len:95 (-) Transcript_29674:195-479(-)
MSVVEPVTTRRDNYCVNVFGVRIKGLPPALSLACRCRYTSDIYNLGEQCMQNSQKQITPHPLKKHCCPCDHEKMFNCFSDFCYEKSRKEKLLRG